jgi:hypothetical protein
MLIELKTKWTKIGNGGGGGTGYGTGIAFDTDTKQVVDFYDSRMLSILDPAPPDANLPAGSYLWFECAADFTQTKWFYDGDKGTYTQIIPNSGECGWLPPTSTPVLTCDLGSVSVAQTAKLDGTYSLAVAVSGKVNGALRYALDNGLEQASNEFTGVAAGAHSVHVRDTGLADCERSIDVLLAPTPVGPPIIPTGPAERIDFVGQPLWYQPIAQAPGAEVLVEVWAESAHGAEDFALVLTLRKRADSQGLVMFRLDTLLWPLLSAWVPPVAGKTTLHCTSNLVNYVLRTTTLAAGQSAVYATSGLRTAVRGALPMEWRTIDYFRWRALPAASSFLSWQPTGPGHYAAGQAKQVTIGQPEWLSWVCPVDVPALRISRTYDLGPGTTAVVDYEAVNPVPARGWQNQLLAIPLAPRAGFKRMVVRVETADGRTLSEPAAYEFIDEGRHSRYLLFTNSLSGLDTLRCEGRLEGTLEASTSQVERPARYGDLAPTADRQLADLAAVRKLKLASGWLTPQELDWVQDLVLSRELWQQVGTQLRPLDASKRTVATYSDAPGLRGLLLEFDYAFAPIAYAPPYAP